MSLIFSIFFFFKSEIFKKKLVYRAAYRGTKEMDILLSSFVNKYIETFNDTQLIALEKFLSYEDEIILNFYHHNINENQIDKNAISKIFKLFKL
jgi:antitoxin CptB